INQGDLTLDFILDERARELYWEGFRRTDLVRYGKFTSGSYLWPWKGGVKSGTAVPDYRNLYPLPLKDLSVNPHLDQNPNY
ncbi:MAG TPA: RagB/SusD family nutrient uptake outer membrane protein, partial [Ginsengibacter sp.]|nr:RagB/SusD family nutrient uptake outer membrane protein [Ginsengibacter sp.]